MKANRTFSNYKTLSIYQSSIFIRLFFVLCGCILLSLITLYIASPYWHSKQFVEHLQHHDILQIKQDIPESLVLAMHANRLAAQHASQQWQGAGATYIKQVWPQIAKNQDMYQLLLLQFNSSPTDTMQRRYARFPNTFKLTQGDAEHSIEFEWQRVTWRTWQLSKLCFYNPQPFDDTKRCASSSR